MRCLNSGNYTWTWNIQECRQQTKANLEVLAHWERDLSGWLGGRGALCRSHFMELKGPFQIILLILISCKFYDFKVPISSKFLFSHLILYFMQWTSAKKFLDFDKNRYFYGCLKTWKSYFLAVDPCRWSQHWHAQSCDADSGMCEFRLDLSCLFNLCKFCFHSPCKILLSSILYELLS